MGIGGVGEWDPSLQSVFEFMVPAMNWSVKMPVLPFDSFLDQSWLIGHLIGWPKSSSRPSLVYKKDRTLRLVGVRYLMVLHNQKTTILVANNITILLQCTDYQHSRTSGDISDPWVHDVLFAVRASMDELLMYLSRNDRIVIK